MSGRQVSTNGSSPSAEYRQWYKTARWQRIRAAQLRAEPLCCMCQARGRVTAATIADHVTPHRGDADLFWNGALQSLCKPDHDSRKRMQETRGYSNEVGTDGMPIDPNHPFNRT